MNLVIIHYELGWRLAKRIGSDEADAQKQELAIFSPFPSPAQFGENEEIQESTFCAFHRANFETATSLNYPGIADSCPPIELLRNPYKLPLWPRRQNSIAKQKHMCFCFTMAMNENPKSTDNRVLNRIYGRGMGSVSTPADFQDLGSPIAVRLALMRHARKGVIRKLARGLYDYPRQDSQLGALSPSIEAVAKALSFRHAIRLQPSGGYAANLLGLSDQVPMRVVFLTDGINRRVQIGKLQIILKRTSPRNMATAGKISGLVIQALRYLGPNHVDALVIRKLRQRLSDKDKRQLLMDLRYAPAWVAMALRKIGERQKS